MIRASLGVALLAAACTPSHVYVPPDWTLRLERDTSFDSAAMLDTTHVVFSWSDGRYRQVAPDPMWGKGPREYVRDEKRIGIYDLAARTGRIVHTELKDRLGDGNGDLVIEEARGGFAVVLRERTTENGVLLDGGGWFLLDLTTEELVRIDLEAALDPRSLALASAPALIDGDGTLLVRAHERAPGRAHLRERDSGSPSAHLLLLNRDGGVIDLGVGQLRGVAAGQVVVSRPDLTGTEVIDSRTGTRHELSNTELVEQSGASSTPRIPAEVVVADDGSCLRVYAGAAQGARESTLRIDVDALP